MNLCSGRVADIRRRLKRGVKLDLKDVEKLIKAQLRAEVISENAFDGYGKLLVAMLPQSHSAITQFLLASEPLALYELHFSIFGAFNRGDFNATEQDGIEYLISEYLYNVNSSASYAAWKAGLVLGEDWLCPRSEHLLKCLMRVARFPAGRMGAINGYRFVVERRKTFRPEELKPLGAVARTDGSRRVRDDARFHLNRLKKMARGEYGNTTPSSGP